MIKVIYNKVCGRCVQSEPLTSGMVGQPIHFEYSHDFDGLAVTAVFTDGKNTVDVVNPGNECIIPHEVLTTVGAIVKVGIYAVKGNELVIPTIYATIGVVQKGADPSGDVSIDPTLPVWAQTQALIGNLSQIETEAKDSLVAAINEVKQTTDRKANAADLATVATSGSYNDLSDKPTIPSVPTATIEANAAARHTHDNKTLLDSITEALKTAWNTASEWVSTNGANVLSHLSDGVKHITANERSEWNGKQDRLIAGDNITIAADGKTISATGGGGGGSTVELDTTLTQSGKAADAKAVGDVTIRQAELGEDGVASFKNAAGIVLFTVDFSNLTPAVYGDMVISAEAVEIAEGSSGTFAVYLATAPTVNQPVYLAVSDNTRLSVSPSSLTFTPENYATPQTVTVTSAQDDDKDDNTITVTLTSRKVDAKQLLVNIVDDDKPVLVENGLEFYINLRNMADQNSSGTQIVDSVGGVVCTTNNVAFDNTSGFVTNDGLTLPTNDTKIQYKYPIKNANVPNGYTYEITTKGMADFHGAGTGVGSGYAHKWSIMLGSDWYLWQADIGRRDATDTALAEWSFGSWLKAQETSFYTDLDMTQEHTYTHVAEVDGSGSVYVDGVLAWTHPADDTFDHYNLQGTITYRLPYMNLKYSMEVAAVRIYERALTADEILQNAKWDISQRAVQTF